MTAHPMLTTDEPVLHFRTELTGNDAVVHVAGELDLATGPDLARALHALLAYPLSRLVVDLRDLVFVDSAGARVLADAQRRARDRGVRMTLRAVNPGPRHVFEEWSRQESHLEKRSGADAFTIADWLPEEECAPAPSAAAAAPGARRRVVHWPDNSGTTRRIHRSGPVRAPRPRRKREAADAAPEH